MSVASGKQLLILVSLTVCIRGAPGASLVKDGVMAMSFSTVQSVRTQLLNFVNQRQVAPPPDVFCNDCLISAWLRRNKNKNFFTTKLSELDESIKAYPEAVKNKLRALAHSSSSTFENFKVDIQKTHMVKTAYIGAARRVGDMVEVALLDVDIEAGLVQKYIYGNKTVCTPPTIWSGTQCKAVPYKEPRGYHANEVNSMTTMLESEAFKMFKEILES